MPSKQPKPVHTSVAVAPAQVWLAALRETDERDPAEQHFICEDHFLPEDISRDEVSSDAIPIMPPCVDGGLGTMGSWGGVPEEDADPWTTDAEEEEDEDDAGPPDEGPPPSGQVGRPRFIGSGGGGARELTASPSDRLLPRSRVQLRTRRPRRGTKAQLHLCFVRPTVCVTLMVSSSAAGTPRVLA